MIHGQIAPAGDGPVDGAAVDDIEPPGRVIDIVAQFKHRFQALAPPGVTTIQGRGTDKEYVGRIKIQRLESKNALAHGGRIAVYPKILGTLSLLELTRGDIERKLRLPVTIPAMRLEFDDEERLRRLIVVLDLSAEALKPPMLRPLRGSAS